MNESRHKLSDPAADAADNAAETLTPFGFSQIMRFLRIGVSPSVPANGPAILP